MKYLFSLSLFVFFTRPAYADFSVASELINIEKLITDAFYAIGLVTFGFGIWGFKKYTENPNSFPISRNIGYVLIGSALISMPSIYLFFMGSSDNGFSSQVFIGFESMAIDPGSLDGLDNVNTGIYKFIPGDSLETLVTFLHLIGLLAFGKGIMMLKDLGDPETNRSSDGLLKKAVVSMVSGFMLMHVQASLCIVGTTFGLSQFSCS